MTSTARIKVDRFGSIDEVEYLNIQAQQRMSIADKITDHRLVATSLVASIRKGWLNRRATQKRGGRTIWHDRDIRAQIGCLRYRREEVAKLQGERDAVA